MSNQLLGMPMMDEPGYINAEASSSRRRLDSGPTAGYKDQQYGNLKEPERQDSFPFDPMSSSTLIATDPQNEYRAGQLERQQSQAYHQQLHGNGYGVFPHAQQEWNAGANLAPYAGVPMQPFPPLPDYSYPLNGLVPDTANTLAQSYTGYSTDNGFQNTGSVFEGSDMGSRRTSWVGVENGEQVEDMGMGDLLALTDEEQLYGLQRM
jgi:hypothetical protein